MYKAYGAVKTRGFRVVWMLEELGVEYEYHPLVPMEPDANAISPTRKLPCLEAEGSIIPDSVAILTYLADHHGALTHPAGTIARAKQDAMTNLIIDEFDALLWTAARHSFALPEAERVPEIKPSLRVEFARNAARLAARMEGDWICGDQFTIADILLTHCLYWAKGAKFVYDAPVLDAYFARAQARPAYQRTAAKF